MSQAMAYGRGTEAVQDMKQGAWQAADDDWQDDEFDEQVSAS